MKTFLIAIIALMGLAAYAPQAEAGGRHYYGGHHRSYRSGHYHYPRYHYGTRYHHRYYGSRYYYRPYYRSYGYYPYYNSYGYYPYNHCYGPGISFSFGF